MLNLLSVTLILILIPVGGDYYLSFFLVAAGVALLMRFRHVRLQLSREKVLLFAVCGILPSLFWSVLQMSEIGVLRQYVYLVLASLFLAIPTTKLKIEHIRQFGILITALLALDFLLLYLDLANVADAYFNRVVNRSFQEFVGAYYRYLGALGSPNLSGVLYALLAANQLIYFRRFKSLVCLLGFALALFLMIVTFSRTAWLSFFLSLLVTREIRLKNYLLFVIPLLCLFYIFFFSGTDSGDVLISRFSDFSSGYDRKAILDDFLRQVDEIGVLFGNPNVPFVLDNDYLLLFFRFGVLGFMSWLGIIVVAIRSGVLRFGSGILPFYVVFLFSSVAGGAIGNPQLSFITLLCVWAYGVAANERKATRPHRLTAKPARTCEGSMAAG